MKKRNLALILSITAIAISVISVCISAYRSPELGFDYQGVIVCIFSLLVTLLIGWNIFSLIDIRKTRDELIATKANSIFNAEKNNVITCHAVSDYYYHVLLKSEPLGIEYQFLYYRISELYHTSNIGNFEMCNSIVKTMLEMIVIPEKICVLPSCKDRLIILLADTKDKDRITGFNDLLSRIARLGIKEPEKK